MTWFIQSSDGDPVPKYFSMQVARNLGSSLGWTERKSDATPFDTEADANQFANRRMNMVNVHIVESRDG